MSHPEMLQIGCDGSFTGDVEESRRHHDSCCRLLHSADSIVRVYLLLAITTAIPLVVFTIYFVLFKARLQGLYSRGTESFERHTTWFSAELWSPAFHSYIPTSSRPDHRIVGLLCWVVQCGMIWVYCYSFQTNALFLISLQLKDQNTRKGESFEWERTSFVIK